jgi:mRNA-degrading endonuclease RelE of RelBE toxin-antitoxin system
MSYSVLSIPPFDTQFKRLSRKYPSLKKEMEVLAVSLEKNPAQGTPIGHSCYKIRLSISSKSKGKSGGARIITHLHISASIVYLLSIYDKNELSNLSDKELNMLVKFIE